MCAKRAQVGRRSFEKLLCTHSHPLSALEFARIHIRVNSIQLRNALAHTNFSHTPVAFSRNVPMGPIDLLASDRPRHERKTDVCAFHLFNHSVPPTPETPSLVVCPSTHSTYTFSICTRNGRNTNALHLAHKSANCWNKKCITTLTHLTDTCKPVACKWGERERLLSLCRHLMSSIHPSARGVSATQTFRCARAFRFVGASLSGFRLQSVCHNSI